MVGVVDHDLLRLCERNPLAGHAHFASRELDEAQRYVGDVFCNHDLSLINRRQDLDTVFDHIRLGGVGLVMMAYGADVLVTPGALENFYLLQMPISGQAAIQFGRDDFHTGPGRASIQHPDEHLQMRWGADCRKVVLRIDRTRFERFVERCTGRPQRQSLRLQSQLELGSSAGQLILDQIKSGLRCADQFGPQNLPPLIVSHIENTLMSALLFLQPHDRTEEFSQLSTTGEGRIVTRVRDYLEAHADEEIDMPRLVEVAGVPLRTLYHLFRQSLGTTPMQLLRDIRLDRVRQALLEGGAERTVTTVAFEWGFDHLGRFAQQYRARFGESPSETLRHRARRSRH
jgi:AraC-like DNA-binding protein